MINFLLSLPTWAGVLFSMVICTVVGLGVYVVSYKLIAKYQTEDMKDSTGGLFRVIGMLVSLMLSLAFADVLVQLRSIENAVERESVAIANIYLDLRQFDDEKTRDIRAILTDYTQSVIDDDWPSLADDRLALRPLDLSQQIQKRVLELDPATAPQKALWSGILNDLDVASDYRYVRLDNAMAQPPIYLYVVFIGFLLTMACFGAYRPQPPLVVLVTMYTWFIGLVLYLILALSDPFQGGIGVDPSTFEYLVERMRGESAKF